MTMVTTSSARIVILRECGRSSFEFPSEVIGGTSKLAFVYSHMNLSLLPAQGRARIGLCRMLQALRYSRVGGIHEWPCCKTTMTRTQASWPAESCRTDSTSPSPRFSALSLSVISADSPADCRPC
jgi:hypothetical protein